VAVVHPQRRDADVAPLLLCRLRLLGLETFEQRLPQQATPQREVERVLSLERATLETPERIDLVARTLLGMGDLKAERTISAGPDPAKTSDGAKDEVAQKTPETGEDGL
jgi:hypothetical protein